MQIEAQVESFEMYIVALDTTLSISRHRAPNMPYTTNAWSQFDRRFDPLPTHLRRQMWMQIEAQVESFEMFIVAFDTTISIFRHRAPNMPYKPTHEGISIADSTPFLPTYDNKCGCKLKLK